MKLSLVAIGKFIPLANGTGRKQQGSIRKKIPFWAEGVSSSVLFFLMYFRGLK